MAPKKETRAETWRRLVSIAKPQKVALIWGMFFLVIASAAGLAYPQIVRWMVDNVLEPRRLDRLLPMVLILFGAFFLQSIAENIRYGNPSATDEEIRRAAKAANALEFVESFPEGMQTRVGEKGIQLSGGQKQRVAIARAILKDPKILILDEATSNLDTESEALVQDALHRLMQERTTLVIAHRLATVRNSDQILVIDQGRVVQQGKHEALAGDTDGLYYRLLQRQFT